MKRVESFWIDEDVKRVWFFSAEFSGVASLGGLGNAVGGIARELAKRGIEVDVFMPSHGRHMSDQHRSILGLRDAGIRAEGDRIGVDGKKYHYRIGVEKGSIDGVNIFLVKGLDYETGKVLDSWEIYSYIEEKSSLLARSVEAIVPWALGVGIPSIIHSHDWHSVLAGVRARQLFEDRRVMVPFVYTIHLLTRVSFPWHYASQDWSGIADCPHYIWKVYRHEISSYREVWDKLSNGSVERFGAYEADVLASVSMSYLTYDIFNHVGKWLEGKSCVTYNGTDWNVSEVREFAKSAFGTDDRKELRNKLLSMLHMIRAVPEDYNTGKILWENRQMIGLREDWTYDDVGEGPLLLASGRVSRQKGVDLLIRAFEDTLKEAPNARLIYFGIPGGEYDLLYHLIDEFSKIKDNARMIISAQIDKNIYKAFYYAASVFTVSSRWEPFGLTAIESMALGTPVVAFAVGGLKETILDLRENPESGTGFLLEPENVKQLSDGLVTAFILSQASEAHDDNLGRTPLFKTGDLSFWQKVRSNAIIRVDQMFRWSSTANSLLECYSKARQMVYYKTQAYF
ncbi:MAG: glycogen/starch synthase [Nitrososphaeria archaeon]|nr:glycogen/starch synthase [Conexivisphaerales archaeon]